MMSHASQDGNAGTTGTALGAERSTKTPARGPRDRSALNSGIMIHLRVKGRVQCQRSKNGDSLVTRKGNSPVTSTRAKYFSITSVCRFVYENTTSTTLRRLDSRDGRTSTPESEKLFWW